MNKFILVLCLTVTPKVAGFASYSGKDCILEDSCPSTRSAVVRRAPRAIAQRADLDAWCPSTTTRRRRAILLVHKKL